MPANNTGLPGWSITGTVKTVSTSVTPHIGSTCVDVCGSGNGSISQLLPTTVGYVYIVKFQHAANVLGGTNFILFTL